MFVRSFIRSFVRSFVHSFVCSFVRSFVSLRYVYASLFARWQQAMCMASRVAWAFTETIRALILSTIAGYSTSGNFVSFKYVILHIYNIACSQC